MRGKGTKPQATAAYFREQPPTCRPAAAQMAQAVAHPPGWRWQLPSAQPQPPGRPCALQAGRQEGAALLSGGVKRSGMSGSHHAGSQSMPRTVIHACTPSRPTAPAPEALAPPPVASSSAASSSNFSATTSSMRCCSASFSAAEAAWRAAAAAASSCAWKAASVSSAWVAVSCFCSSSISGRRACERQGGRGFVSGLVGVGQVGKNRG